MSAGVERSTDKPMDVADFLDTYISLSSIGGDGTVPIQKEIASRHEFAQLTLPRIEKITGEMLLHQKIMRRLINPWTPYTSILVDQKMGTGKSRLAANVAEGVIEVEAGMRNRYEATPMLVSGIPHRKVLVLANNRKLINNLKRDIVEAFPEKYSASFGLTEIKTQRKKEIRMNKLLNENYEFHTFRTFASLVDRRITDPKFLATYANRVIIIDEAHLLRPQTAVAVPHYTEFELYARNSKLAKTDTLDVRVAAHKFLRDRNYEDSDGLANILAKEYTRPTKRSKMPAWFDDFADYLRRKTSLGVDDISDDPERIRGEIMLFARERADDEDEVAEPASKDVDAVVNEITGKNRSAMEVYRPLHQFLHTISKPRILALTGSPMYDTKNEIAYIANLILPQDQQMSFDPTDDEIREKMRNRVSFLRFMTTEVPKVDVGETIYTQHLKLSTHAMTKFQATAYRKAYAMDVREMTTDGDDDTESKSVSAFYQNSRQATDLVFPDGSWGEKGLRAFATGKGLKAFRDAIRDRLQELSCKLHFVINDISRHPKQKAYLYSEHVGGSGIDAIELVLQTLGWERSNGNERTPGLRYAVITGKTSEAETTRLLERLNSEDNAEGDYIRLIIGSFSASLGLSYLDIQRIYMYTSTWNNSSLEQAIFRGIRVGSHRHLIARGVSPLTIFVHRMAAVDEKHPLDSIDVKLYQLAESKDIEIQAVERILKEVSIDCMLTKNRNRLPQDVDGSRECEYRECEYVCADEADTGSMPLPSNYRTWTMYYSSPEISQIQSTLHDLLLSNGYVDIRTLKATTSTIRNIAIASYIKEYRYVSDVTRAIAHRVAFMYPYIFIAPVMTPLRKDVDTPLDAIYYVKSLTLQRKLPVSTLVEFRREQLDLQLLQDICAGDADLTAIDRLSMPTKIDLVQHAIENRKSRSALVALVLEAFASEIDGKTHSVGGTKMVLRHGQWVEDVSSSAKKTTKVPESGSAKRRGRKTIVKKNYRDLMEDMVFGVMDNKQFFIVDKRFDDTTAGDKRKLNTGRSFNNYTKLDLITLLQYEGVPRRESEMIDFATLEERDKIDLAKDIESSDPKSYKTSISSNIDSYTMEDLLYILSWSVGPTTNKKDIGNAILDVFRESGKLVEME